MHVLCSANRRMLRQRGLCEAALSRIVITIPRFNAIYYISECRSGTLNRLQGHRARSQHLESSFWSQRYASQLDTFPCEQIPRVASYWDEDPAVILRKITAHEVRARRLLKLAILPISCFVLPVPSSRQGWHCVPQSLDADMIALHM